MVLVSVSIFSQAKSSRSGVNFPAHTFENHAETEAFGKMAKSPDSQLVDYLTTFYGIFMNQVKTI